MSGEATKSEIALWACAQAWRGDGEIIASAMGTLPTIAVRWARATFEPDLVLTDGVAKFVSGTWPIDRPATGPVEGWAPFRSIFDYAATGRRHAVMGASQFDQYGQSNISAIGSDFARPKRQLLGVRGVPTNTINHRCGYFIPRHSTRVFVPEVDVVSGVGFRSPRADEQTRRFVGLSRVVTDLAVLDVDPDQNRLRLASVHPWASVDEVVTATGFELLVAERVPVTPGPGPDELAVLREEIDPRGARRRELPDD
jgi:acyl CoA:acetate/3-ketoacid CoA transferase beta subunit